MLVFDAEPVLAFLVGEPRARRVRPLLERVSAGREPGGMSRVNLAEVAYVLERRGPGAGTAAVLELEAHGISAIPCEPAWREAFVAKSRHPALSLGDAFAAGTAKALRAKLVVAGDAPLLEACRNMGVAAVRT